MRFQILHFFLSRNKVLFFFLLMKMIKIRVAAVTRVLEIIQKNNTTVHDGLKKLCQ